MSYSTQEEKLWAEKFGDDYQMRNNSLSLLNNKEHMYKQVFRNINEIYSVIEFGANIGLNLKAIMSINKNITDIRAVELNKMACDSLKNIENCDVIQKSIVEYDDYNKQYDMSLSAGLLIHLNPSLLPKAYDVLYNSSKKYICIAEYYDPNPVSIPYRGHHDKLFKRDFAGELMNRYTNLKLIDYNFIYKRDPKYPLDDITWFLLEK